MSKARLQQTFNWMEAKWPLVLAPLLVTTTLLWTFALSASFAWQNLVSGFFYTLQFVVLNKEVDSVALKDANPLLLYGLTLAQFAIPLTASIAFFGTLFREQITPFLKRRVVRGMEGHQVILGMGVMGAALLTELSKSHAQTQVVVVDLHTSQHPDTTYLTHLQHNALSPDLFELVNLGNAKKIYLLLPDERENLGILASLAQQIVRDDLTVFVRTESNALRRLFADWAWFGNGIAAGKMDVRPINPYDIAARGIVNAFSPDKYEATDRDAHIAQTVMVVGASPMAQALVLRFARQGVYSPNGKLRLIWSGKGAQEALDGLGEHYPVLQPGHHPDSHWGMPVSMSTETLHAWLSPLEIVTWDKPAADAIGDGQLASLCTTQWPAAVYVCHDSDVQNAVESRDIQAALDRHTSIPMASTRAQRRILAVQNHAAIGVGQPFGDTHFAYRIEEVCIDAYCAQTLISDRADDLAKKFDAVWSSKQAVQSVQWNTSHFFLKETNRDPADHAAIKMRFAGIASVKVDKCVLQGQACLDARDIEQLSKQSGDLQAMEMRRYRAFMFLHGFGHGQASLASETMTRAQAKDLDRRRKVNETLLDTQLSDIQKSKDADIVRVMVNALQMQVPGPNPAS